MDPIAKRNDQIYAGLTIKQWTFTLMMWIFGLTAIVALFVCVCCMFASHFILHSTITCILRTACGPAIADSYIDNNTKPLPNFLLPLRFYHSSLTNDSHTRMIKVVSDVQQLFHHESFGSRIFTKVEFHQLDSDIDCSTSVTLDLLLQNLLQFMEYLPEQDEHGVNIFFCPFNPSQEPWFRWGTLNGVAWDLGNLCAENRKLSTALVKWKTSEDDLYLAYLIAHEIGHVLGMDHDFESFQNYPTLKRKVTCAPNLWDTMIFGKIAIMNSGRPSTSNFWSKCSRIDWRNYYDNVMQNTGMFCLKEAEEQMDKQEKNKHGIGSAHLTDTGT